MQGWITFGVGVFVGLAIWGGQGGKLESAISQCEDVSYDYSSSLERANNTIDSLNSQIEDANSLAWTSYDEMGEALENLYTEDTEDDPGTECYIEE